MPNLASALRADIRSAAGSEFSRALAPLRSIERSLKTIITLLRRGPGARTGVGGRRRGPGGDAAPSIRPSEVRAIRRRFRMNRPQFGRLVGVSTWTVFMWEHGQVIPSPESVARLREVAKMKAGTAVDASERTVPRRSRAKLRRR
jgi:DNA-binding XRE family transcriptional regulator